jgi:hypothetical protein
MPAALHGGWSSGGIFFPSYFCSTIVSELKIRHTDTTLPTTHSITGTQNTHTLAVLFYIDDEGGSQFSCCSTRCPGYICVKFILFKKKIAVKHTRPG